MDNLFYHYLIVDKCKDAFWISLCELNIKINLFGNIITFHSKTTIYFCSLVDKVFIMDCSIIWFTRNINFKFVISTLTIPNCTCYRNIFLSNCYFPIKVVFCYKYNRIFQMMQIVLYIIVIFTVFLGINISNSLVNHDNIFFLSVTMSLMIIFIYC